MSQATFLVKPKTEDELIRLTQENTIYQDPRQLQSLPQVVTKAVRNGFVKLGYDYMDYMRESVRGVPVGNYEGAPRKKGYVETLYWQEAGTGKSNLALQHGFRLLAGEPEERGPDFDEDSYWRYVIYNQTVMEEEQLNRIYTEITQRGPQDPIYWVNIDDVTTSIPKHLWQTKGGMKKFSNLHRFIAVIRPYIKVLCFSSPFPENLVSILTENLKMEIVVYPNQTYVVERYVRDVDSSKAATSVLRKIIIEYSSYNLDAIPKDWWDKYEERRFQVTQKVAKELQESSDTTLNEDEIKESKAKLLRQSMPSTIEMENYMRSNGFKFDNRVAQAYVRGMKELTMKRAGIGFEDEESDL